MRRWRDAGAELAVALSLADAAHAALDARQALDRRNDAIGREVGGFVLTDVDGRRVSLAAFRGRPLLVSFVYTGCGEVCPATTRLLAGAVAKARASVGADTFRVVTIGFNQPIDNPAAMQRFARQNGIDDPDWRFLAPDLADVERLTAAFGFSYAAAQGGFDHLSQVTLVDAGGRIERQVYGDTFPLTQLVAPLRAMVLGQAPPAGDLRGLLERVRVLCTVYDPASGRYRLDYALFIEVFAGLTFLAGTAWFLVREWRQGRGRRGGARRPC
jgi:protein SCO1/2